MKPSLSPVHLLSFDVEHWYESWRQRGLGGYEGFSDCDTPIVRSILDLLDETGRKATFFITGRFARSFASLVREIDARGHEVASHSDQHSLLHAFPTFAALREDTIAGLDSVEQAAGCKVEGYRAPKWSLPPERESEFFALLAARGLSYDSSFFATRSTRPDQLLPHTVMTASGPLVEIPATACRLGPVRIPCGGAYFRLLPLAATRLMLRQHEREGRPGMLYAHPYDLNPTGHMVPGTGPYLRLMRTVGVKSAMRKLRALCEQENFVPIRDWLRYAKESLPQVAG